MHTAYLYGSWRETICLKLTKEGEKRRHWQIGVRRIYPRWMFYDLGFQNKITPRVLPKIGSQIKRKYRPTLVEIQLGSVHPKYVQTARGQNTREKRHLRYRARPPWLYSYVSGNCLIGLVWEISGRSRESVKSWKIMDPAQKPRARARS